MPIFFTFKFKSIQDQDKIKIASLSSPLASHSPTSFRSKTKNLEVDWCGRRLYLCADDDSDSELPNQSSTRSRSSGMNYDHRKIDS